MIGWFLCECILKRILWKCNNGITESCKVKELPYQLQKNPLIPLFQIKIQTVKMYPSPLEMTGQKIALPVPKLVNSVLIILVTIYGSTSVSGISLKSLKQPVP